jgi:hypothetical protein
VKRTGQVGLVGGRGRLPLGGMSTSRAGCGRTQLYWLSLLLIRVAETATGSTWRNLRDELERMHLGTFSGPAGLCQTRTETTAGQREILAALDLPAPPLFRSLEPAATA